MNRLMVWAVVLAAGAMAACAAVSRADMITLGAFLDGSQVVEPVVTLSEGEALLTYDSSTKEFSMFVLMTRFIPSTETATAVIHVDNPGQNGPSILTLPQAWVRAGALMTCMLSNVAFPSQYEADLLAGRTYIDIHTPSYPNGLIRGQLVSEPAPEPAALAVLGVGGLTLLARRRAAR